MTLPDANDLITEYVELYNRYITLPEDSKELKELTLKLQYLENMLTMCLLYERGYTLKRAGNDKYGTYVKESH